MQILLRTNCGDYYMERGVLDNIFEIATIEIATKFDRIIAELKNMCSLAWTHSIIKFITV